MMKDEKGERRWVDLFAARFRSESARSQSTGRTRRGLWVVLTASGRSSLGIGFLE